MGEGTEKKGMAGKRRNQALAPKSQMVGDARTYKAPAAQKYGKSLFLCHRSLSFPRAMQSPAPGKWHGSLEYVRDANSWKPQMQPCRLLQAGRRRR